MPNYQMKDKNTGEVFTITLKMAEKDPYLEENPHLEQVLATPVTVDPTRVGAVKPDQGFRDVLTKAKEAHPHGNIEL